MLSMEQIGYYNFINEQQNKAQLHDTQKRINESGKNKKNLVGEWQTTNHNCKEAAKLPRT